MRFISSKIDEECGYVQGSKLVLYTSKYKEDVLNIVHIHVNDMNDEVTFAVDYMQEGENLSQYSKFGTDVTG